METGLERWTRAVERGEGAGKSVFQVGVPGVKALSSVGEGIHHWNWVHKACKTSSTDIGFTLHSGAEGEKGSEGEKGGRGTEAGGVSGGGRETSQAGDVALLASPWALSVSRFALTPPLLS